jgi:ABC-type multidrug transport system fused ATPase/permease subunit
MERTGGEAVPAPAGGAGARVEVRDLAYSRFGRRPAFEGVSFAVEPGERIALLGTRGSGTSSLLELVLGMREPLAGEVAVDGLAVRSWDLAALRAQACIIRSTDLISGTVGENVRLGDPSMPLRDINAALERVGLLDAVRAMPDGLGTRLVTGGLPLAGRQRARLLAARALAHRPRLLLLDELLDGHEGTLDALARVLIDAPLPWTVIVATRDPRVAARCGRTIEIGAHAEAVRHG